MKPVAILDPNALVRTIELARRTPEGCFVEVGVYRGGSAWPLAELARERGVKLHLFDTFTGIPFHRQDDTNRTGEFGDVSVADVQSAIPDAVFHVGIFPETLPDDLQNIAFVHCDCDQYDSVSAVIDKLWPRMVPDGIMVFDDWNTHLGRQAILERFPEPHQYCGRFYVVKGSCEAPKGRE